MQLTHLPRISASGCHCRFFCGDGNNKLYPRWFSGADVMVAGLTALKFVAPSSSPRTSGDRADPDRFAIARKPLGVKPGLLHRAFQAIAPFKTAKGVMSCARHRARYPIRSNPALPLGAIFVAKIDQVADRRSPTKPQHAGFLPHHEAFAVWSIYWVSDMRIGHRSYCMLQWDSFCGLVCQAGRSFAGAGVLSGRVP